MKATEYIEKLQNLVNEHGDFDVVLDFYDEESSIDVSSDNDCYEVSIEYYKDELMPELSRGYISLEVKDEFKELD